MDVNCQHNLVRCSLSLVEEGPTVVFMSTRSLVAYCILNLESLPSTTRRRLQQLASLVEVKYVLVAVLTVRT
jgi:hypothetical protein